MWLKYMITPKIFSNKFRIFLVSECDFIAEAILDFSSSCPCSESFLLRAGNMARKLFLACPPSRSMAIVTILGEHGYRKQCILACPHFGEHGQETMFSDQFAQGFRSSNKHVTIAKTCPSAKKKWFNEENVTYFFFCLLL